MYGTIAHFRLKSGVKDEFVKAMQDMGDDILPGWRADYYYQMDANPDDFYLVAIFEDKETYQSNADSSEQHERYLKFRSFLAADPEWHDGTIVSATGPNSK